jgi:cytoplasmic tRNA 2-thiolation protein 1
LFKVVKPTAILNIIEAAETMRFKASSEDSMPQPGKCERCGYISSQKVCKACLLLDGLNRGVPNLGIGRTRAPPGAGKLKSEANGTDPPSVQNGQAKDMRARPRAVVLEYEA